MLDYRYHTFLVLAQTRSFTQTAQLLHLSQPSITAQMHALEKELDTPLYTYRKRHFELTDKGKAVYAYCCKVEQLNDQLNAALDTIQSQPIRIVSTSIIGNYLVPKVIAEWLNHDNMCRIEQHILTTPQCLAMIDQGKADCALIEGYVDAVVYPCQTIKKAHLVCCCAPQHPLVQSTKIQLEDLLKYPLIVKERHDTNRGILPHALANHNLSYDSFINTVVVGSISGMKQLLIANGGIGFLHEDAVKDELNHGSLVKLTIDDFDLSHDMVMIINPNTIHEQAMDDLYQRLCQLG